MRSHNHFHRPFRPIPTGINPYNSGQDHSNFNCIGDPKSDPQIREYSLFIQHLFLLRCIERPRKNYTCYDPHGLPYQSC